MMRQINLFSILMIFFPAWCSSFGQVLSPEEEAVWRLEERRVEYIAARDVEKVRAMYHPDFVGWPSRIASPFERSGV